MSPRFLVTVAALAAILAAPLPGQAPKPAATKSAIPRTPDGHPDLQGIWTNATLTPVERSAAFKDKLNLTDAEAKAFEAGQNKELQDTDGKSESPLLASAGSNGTGGYNVLFIDRGSALARVDGSARSSLVIDPADGKVPAMTKEAQGRMMQQFRSFNTYNSVKDRPTSERCLVGFGSTSGPPMMPVLYNNNYQIVQTPDAIMILTEMVHDVRIVRMNGTHAPANVKQWLGDAIGHWDGDTLVVETTNIREDNAFRGGSDQMKITERFKRIDAKTILYRVTVDDPGTFAKPWTMEYPFNATAGPIYEYACHEGNYAMPDILGGARLSESGKK